MTLPRTADVVVVGCGTVGAWASVFAAEHGAGRVLCLDAGVAGGGASPRAAGMVRTQGGTETAVDLARSSVDFYRGQHDRFGIDSGFRSLGYLILAGDEHAATAARDRVALHRRRGLDSRWVTASEVAALHPLLDVGGIAGATYCADDGAIDPVRNMTAALVAQRAVGVQLVEHCPVTGLDLDGDAVVGVRTPRGTVATRTVILAAGLGQPHLSQLAGGPAVPVGGARHQVAVTSPHSQLTAALPMVFDLDHGLYWRPEENGILVGMSNPDERPGEATALDWEMLRFMRARLADLLPVARGIDLRKVWAATIDYTPDHLPILGPLLDAGRQPVRGATLASAAGHGMMWGPGVARAAADLAVTGSTTVTDVGILGADRFGPDGTSRLATDPVALPFPAGVPASAAR